MKNPFNALTRIALSPSPVLPSTPPVEVAPEKTVEKGNKSKVSKGELSAIDRVKIYSACVPSLESAKDDLKEVLAEIEDSDTHQKISEFVDQIEGIQLAVLEFCKLAIKTKKDGETAAVTTDAPAQVDLGGQQIAPAPVQITAGMISGKDPIPEELLVSSRQ